MTATATQLLALRRHLNAAASALASAAATARDLADVPAHARDGFSGYEVKAMAASLDRLRHELIIDVVAYGVRDAMVRAEKDEARRPTPAGLLGLEDVR